MKKTILSIIALVFCVMVNAQTITDARVYESFRIKATVIDIKNSVSIPYVSVYLIPKGDTTVTNFAISDKNGRVVMENVRSGQYELYAEHLGYSVFKKRYDITSAPGWDIDLGPIGLEESM